jgi:hypothetical protein
VAQVAKIAEAIAPMVMREENFICGSCVREVNQPINGETPKAGL